MAMNLYGLDYTLMDLGFVDPTLVESLSSSDSMIVDRRLREREEENLLKLSSSILRNIKRNSSPPKQRHDGTSPLPLGMDWSPPPRNWDGPNAIWPHDYHTGWSYSATIPSWSIFSESEGSEPVVFYRVQVGLQSPEGVTTTREVLKRFSDFLKLSSDLKQSFSKKKLPSAPPKGLLRKKGPTHLEERRCSLEDWMAKVLSDIDVSRSAPVACFLELEAVVRSSFSESKHHVQDVNLAFQNSGNIGCSSDPLLSNSDVSVVAGTLAFGSSDDNDSTCETSEIGAALYVKNKYSESGKEITSDVDLASLTEATVLEDFCENNNNSTPPKEFNKGKQERHLHKFDEKTISDKKIHAAPIVSYAKDSSLSEDCDTSPKCSGSVEASESLDTLASSGLQLSHDKLVVLQLDEEQKMNKLLNAMQQRVVTSKDDVEELIARLNQELAARQHLATKVKDLETELDSIKKCGKENLEQAVLVERERYTQMQWDMEEVKQKCMDMELKLKAEQDGKARAEETTNSFIKENESLRRELNSSREQLKNLQKCHEETDVKSKADFKLLVKEVKSLRSSQSELRQDLDRVETERTELVTRLEKEKIKQEHIDAANTKLLQECETLRHQLEECSVSFVFEQGNKLKVDGLSPSDALDTLATSEDHAARLLEEARLLAQGIATPVTGSRHESDDGLRKMLTDILIDNAILRKQATSIARCAFSTKEVSNS